MAGRTYLPGLRFVARALCAYIRRYERQIRENLSAPNQILMDAALAACAALDIALDAVIPVGD
jgi:hypothetical protein